MTHIDTIQFHIAKNLQQTEQQIAQACERSNRSVDDVCLVAVTKYAQIEWVQALTSLGITHLGESRPQQLVERSIQFDSSVNWHLIGHLQRNKVRPLLPAVSVIHSVDSMRLLQRLNQQAKELSLSPKLLLEVNISGEEAKDGFSPHLLSANWNEIVAYEQIEIAGLMTMAPLSNQPEETRPVFAKLRKLRDELQERSEGKVNLQELSMGMSRDFEIAIEEGATIVRVGSKLFEGLT
ncbi:UPF0001 protein YggS [hydrothermal vent metagenome]|uniref:UPF0001 protein YggS n=1 Tax=hydrothermal vent metagenome TaxID=652676 RepID=A0A3B1DQY1_9ZZZZ